jgi:alpha-amylase/alpha-mannosidase (GH57 family)
MERYLCIHAHFYQPPRENPWLEAIEAQPSAYPYHDWNERITAECYAPNGAARIVNAEGKIARVVNNYARISFNFGPTLLSWIEEQVPDVYERILAADVLSRERFSGHGNAIAQAYNHMILPLANRRDKETQIKWGIRDFERRFRRAPEGMWLPETAVDNETLEILADHGIAFTILAPLQAGRVRSLKSGARWKDVTGGRLDPTRAYQARLGGDRKIALFFYDGAVSRAVAFEKLLNSGEQFAARLMSGYSDHRDWPQLMHIATDGESYGHHHPHGDMALAYALDHIEHNRLAAITNYGEYLEKHPPQAEAQIIERTAWSCSHGVERWNSDCGCNSGVDFRQPWRAPLRSALDWLRDTTNAIAEPGMRELLRDPWQARDQYIDIMLGRSPESIRRFLTAHAKQELSREETVVTLKLLEVQRHLLLMFTSCGWFFNEISGIETVKLIEYAGRAIQLMRELFPDAPLEHEFLARLEHAPSRLAEDRNGAEIYGKWVKPAVKSLDDVGAHYAISTLFERRADIPIYCYTADQRRLEIREAGSAGFAAGQVEICSRITLDCKLLSFAVLHFGDHNITAAVREFRGDAAFDEFSTQMMEAFARAELADVLRLMDKHFDGGGLYTLRSLFADERQKIVEKLLAGTLRAAESAYRQIYDRHAPLLRFLSANGMPKPRVLTMTSEFVLNANLERELGRQELDPARVGALLEEAQNEQVTVDAAGLGYALQRSLTKKMKRLREDPQNAEALRAVLQASRLAQSTKFPVNLWRAQNIFYEVVESVNPIADAQLWNQLMEIAETLGIDSAQFRERVPAAVA